MALADYLTGYTGEYFDPNNASKMWKEVLESNNVSADGDTVKSFRGSFANIQCFDAVGTLPGTYKTNIVNGRSVLRCATTRLQTTFASGVTIFDKTLPYTAFLVAEQDAVGDEAIISTTETGAGNIIRFHSNGGTQELRTLWPLTDGATGAGANTWAIYLVRNDATSGGNGDVRAYVNGVLKVTVNGARDASDGEFGNFCIASAFNSQRLVGDIGYIFLANRALTDAECDVGGNELATNFGLSWTNIVVGKPHSLINGGLIDRGLINAGLIG